MDHCSIINTVYLDAWYSPKQSVDCCVPAWWHTQDTINAESCTTTITFSVLLTFLATWRRICINKVRFQEGFVKRKRRRCWSLITELHISTFISLMKARGMTGPESRPNLLRLLYCISWSSCLCVRRAEASVGLLCTNQLPVVLTDWIRLCHWFMRIHWGVKRTGKETQTHESNEDSKLYYMFSK